VVIGALMATITGREGGAIIADLRGGRVIEGDLNHWGLSMAWEEGGVRGGGARPA
jgi:hypothetical protein